MKKIIKPIALVCMLAMLFSALPNIRVMSAVSPAIASHTYAGQRVWGTLIYPQITSAVSGTTYLVKVTNQTLNKSSSINVVSISTGNYPFSTSEAQALNMYWVGGCSYLFEIWENGVQGYSSSGAPMQAPSNNPNLKIERFSSPMAAGVDIYWSLKSNVNQTYHIETLVGSISSTKIHTATGTSSDNVNSGKQWTVGQPVRFILYSNYNGNKDKPLCVSPLYSL